MFILSFLHPSSPSVEWLNKKRSRKVRANKGVFPFLVMSWCVSRSPERMYIKRKTWTGWWGCQERQERDGSQWKHFPYQSLIKDATQRIRKAVSFALSFSLSLSLSLSFNVPQREVKLGVDSQTATIRGRKWRKTHYFSWWLTDFLLTHKPLTLKSLLFTFNCRQQENEMTTRDSIGNRVKASNRANKRSLSKEIPHPKSFLPVKHT